MMNKSIRFTDHEVRLMRLLLKDRRTLDEVAEYFGTSREYVRQIKDNLVRKGIGVDASYTASLTQGERRKKRAEGLFEEGKSTQQIADILKISRVQVFNYLRDLRQKRRAELMRQAHALHSSGLAKSEIASRLHVAPKTVSLWLSSPVPKESL